MLSPEDVGEAGVGLEDVGVETVGDGGGDGIASGLLPGTTAPQYLLPSLRAVPHVRPEQHALSLHTVLVWPHPSSVGAGVGAGVAPGAPGLSYHSHLFPQLLGPVSSKRRGNH